MHHNRAFHFEFPPYCSPNLGPSTSVLFRRHNLLVLNPHSFITAVKLLVTFHFYHAYSITRDPLSNHFRTHGTSPSMHSQTVTSFLRPQFCFLERCTAQSRPQPAHYFPPNEASRSAPDHRALQCPSQHQPGEHPTRHLRQLSSVRFVGSTILLVQNLNSWVHLLESCALHAGEPFWT